MCSREGLAEILLSEWRLLGHADDTEALQCVNEGCAVLLGSGGNISLLVFATFPRQEL